MDEDEKEQKHNQLRSVNVMNLNPYLEKAKASQEDDEPAAMVEAILAAMKDSGTDDKSLLMQRKMLEAKFGIGSWQDVMAVEEETLKERAAQNDLLGQLGSLTNLIGMAINGGDKEKGRQYVAQAEELLDQISADDIKRSLPEGSPVSAETLLQLRWAEIERLRHWVT